MMHTYVFVTLSLLSIGIQLNGQVQSFCESDSIINDITARHTNFEPTLKEFIIKRILEDQSHEAHLSSWKNLEEFTLWVCNEKKAVLQFELSRDTVLQVTVEQTKREFNALKKQRKRSYLPMGKNLEDSIGIISSMIVSVGNVNHEIPEEVFKDLFSPNFCEVALPINQIKAFLSNDRTHVYIYFFRKVNVENELDFYREILNSYLAKVVVNLKNGYVAKIVVPARILEVYRWLSCPAIWPGF
jgi:hypothetical protein